MRILFLSLGIFCVIAGIIGIFLPVWPTTPFLLAAAFCFAKSSPKLYYHLAHNEYIGSFLRNYREKCGVPRIIVFRAFAFLWLTLGISIFFTENNWLRILLFLIGTAVSIHLFCLKRSARKPLRFTLIELLVSLGIIALLASMLFPLLNRARNAAQRGVCQNNLRQIGLALNLYADGNHGSIPSLIPAISGSIMILRMPPLGVIGLGRLLDQYGANERLFGCPQNSTRSPGYVAEKWRSQGAVQAAYLYRSTDVGFHEKLSSNDNAGKAIVMDFCCVQAGGNSIIAHNYETVNILYSDGAVLEALNTPEPQQRYTVSMITHGAGQPIPLCTEAWQNADLLSFHEKRK